MKTTPPSRLAALVLASASLTLAACGSGEKGSAVPANPDVVVVAPQGRGLIFDKTSYTAVAGDVALAYRNDDVQTHTMILEDTTGKRMPGFKRIVLGARRAAGATITLTAGTYKLVCDIHLPTMVADLVVTP